MEIRIQLTYRDFLDGFYAHHGRTRSRRLMFYGTRAFCIAMIVLAIVVLIFDHSPETVQQLKPFFIAMSIWCVALFGYIPFVAWQQWKNSPKLAQLNIYEFSDDGYSFRGETSEGKAIWANIVQWTESKKVLLLYPSAAIFAPLPKRLFSRDELDEVRAIISRHVKRA